MFLLLQNECGRGLMGKIKTYLKEVQRQMLEKEFQNALMVQQIVNTNKKTFEKYRNIYQGKSC
jgi:hypothetical protein